ncbi:hypothetical protein SAMN02799631_05922 [Methylobacterium sp. 174MFSha1.1]|uniref:hypothetical protein n=1 Tax=Methylobacterium sp. 174MFSha1.1 TaxID=1502749 RepID=UPI0008DF3D11|nr:hypothetical protein [Methylobacterium sp. 174MFSha1.1]SFV14604.1 hypothetical protein SAMN02799631_05922 [Methylobacterium sp. 174MFSha1.1]
MRNIAFAFGLIIFSIVCETTKANALVGAADGGYRAADGDYIHIDSKENMVGVQGLDCKNPTVEAGRLRAKACWSNGHIAGDVDVTWRVDGNAIETEGKRYISIPPLPQPSKATKADPFQPSEDGWLHNRSEVRVDPKTNSITYLRLKPDLRGVVKAGAVLYRGDLKPGSLMLGTAYAFKQGCAPASYPVRGIYSKHNEILTLTGPGPIRKGCEVVAYSYDSPHSRLVFEYIVGD